MQCALLHSMTTIKANLVKHMNAKDKKRLPPNQNLGKHMSAKIKVSSTSLTDMSSDNNNERMARETRKCKG